MMNCVPAMSTDGCGTGVGAGVGAGAGSGVGTTTGAGAGGLTTTVVSDGGAGMTLSRWSLPTSNVIRRISHTAGSLIRFMNISNAVGVGVGSTGTGSIESLSGEDG